MPWWKDSLAKLGILKPAAAPVVPARKATGPYEGASMSRRAEGWQTANYGPSSAPVMSANTLRARSRQLIRNNAWASNACETFTSEVIGSGIKPQSRHPEQKIRTAIHEAWLRWTDEADADGRMDLYGLQALIVREEFEAGEVFIRFRPRRPQDGLSVPLQLQVIEADLCPLEKTEVLQGGNVIKAGIELDRIENRAAYWMYREHPGDIGLRLSNDMTPHRVPAAEVMHVNRMLRSGQLRGQPRLAPVMVKLHELGAYDDAEVARKKVAAMFAGFIKKNFDAENPMLVTPEPGQSQAVAEAAQMAQYTTPLEPALMQVLLPGWDVTFAAPADVGPNYEIFIKTQLKAIACGVCLSHDQLSNDAREVNYSSQRAVVLTIRRKMEQFRENVIVFQFCRLLWRRWIEAAVLAGAIDGVTAAMYNQNPYLFQNVEWRSAAWPWVDPVKDAQAEKMLVRSLFKSRSAVIHERGDDPERVDQEISEDNARADKLGLVSDADARQTSASGGTGKTERTDSAGGVLIDDDDTDERPEVVH